MPMNEARQQVCAFGRVQIDHLDTPLPQPVDAATKSARLTDDHFSDAELHYQAAAVPAWCERSDHNLILVAPLTTRLTKCVSLTVDGRIVFLDTAVVSAP